MNVISFYQKGLRKLCSWPNVVYTSVKVKNKIYFLYLYLFYCLPKLILRKRCNLFCWFYFSIITEPHAEKCYYRTNSMYWDR